jgi:hypothetical protein
MNGWDSSDKYFDHTTVLRAMPTASACFVTLNS